MSNITQTLIELAEIDGAMCSSLVDSSTGMILGDSGSGVDIELAAAGNSEVVKAKLNTMKNLKIKERINDILITLDTQYHIITPLTKHEGLFIYLVLSKSKSNLALARRKVLEIEKNITL